MVKPTQTVQNKKLINMGAIRHIGEVVNLGAKVFEHSIIWEKYPQRMYKYDHNHYIHDSNKMLSANQKSSMKNINFDKLPKFRNAIRNGDLLPTSILYYPYKKDNKKPVQEYLSDDALVFFTRNFHMNSRGDVIFINEYDKLHNENNINKFYYDYNQYGELFEIPTENNIYIHLTKLWRATVENGEDRDTIKIEYRIHLGENALIIVHDNYTYWSVEADGYIIYFNDEYSTESILYMSYLLYTKQYKKAKNYELMMSILSIDSSDSEKLKLIPLEDLDRFEFKIVNILKCVFIILSQICMFHKLKTKKILKFDKKEIKKRGKHEQSIKQ